MNLENKNSERVRRRRLFQAKFFKRTILGPEKICIPPSAWTIAGLRDWIRRDTCYERSQDFGSYFQSREISRFSRTPGEINTQISIFTSTVLRFPLLTRYSPDFTRSICGTRCTFSSYYYPSSFITLRYKPRWVNVRIARSRRLVSSETKIEIELWWGRGVLL